MMRQLFSVNECCRLETKILGALSVALLIRIMFLLVQVSLY
jgi:hypothetical protein